MHELPWTRVYPRNSLAVKVTEFMSKDVGKGLNLVRQPLRQKKLLPCAELRPTDAKWLTDAFHAVAAGALLLGP